MDKQLTRNVTKEAGRSDRHKFLHQQPSCVDHQLWVDAIKKISSPFLTFLVPLGESIAPSHKGKQWTTNKEETRLHLEIIIVDNSSQFFMYDLSTVSRTHSRRKFMQSNMLQHDPLLFYASVIWISDNIICLCSWIKGYKTRKKSTSFWDNIRSYGNPSMWKNLQCYGNGSWVWQGLSSGSLVIVHDGLYMKEISPFVCSATVIIHSITTGSSCKCTIAKNTLYAGSYCGKILGTILTQLILRAAVQGRIGPYPVIIEYCNNKGVIKNGNTPYWPITTTQIQSDVLRVIKQFIIAQPFKLKFLYVASHCYDSKRSANCTHNERMNI